MGGALWLNHALGSRSQFRCPRREAQGGHSSGQVSGSAMGRCARGVRGFNPAARLKPQHVGEPAGDGGRLSLQRQVRLAGPPPSGRRAAPALATFPAVLTGTTATLGRKPEWIFQRRRSREAHWWVQPSNREASWEIPARTLVTVSGGCGSLLPTPNPEAVHLLEAAKL